MPTYKPNTAQVLVLSVLFALTLFIIWHLYLVGTNQTTIEFYSNRFDASDAKQRGEVWVNPYSMGWRENFQQVFGMSRCAALCRTPRVVPPAPCPLEPARPQHL